MIFNFRWLSERKSLAGCYYNILNTEYISWDVFAGKVTWSPNSPFCCGWPTDDVWALLLDHLYYYYKPHNK